MAIDWNHIQKITDEYNKIAGAVLNVEQFNLYALTHHSTKIEGSTLTLEETNALLEKGTSIGGKPIQHQNMVLDHQEALEWMLVASKEKKPISVSFLQELSARVMRRTGREINSILGNTSESQGDFRTVNVSAGGYYFVDQAKVVPMVNDLVLKINERMENVKSIAEILTLSFLAHFDLVSIHPFTDGNGRVSRLLMNYIQAYHRQPLTLVHSEDRVSYIEALKQSREIKDTTPIIEFLANQHQKALFSDIKAFRSSIEFLNNQKGRTDGYSMVF
jgi:Fic family protein